MACGSCSKARARRKASLEARRAAAARKLQDRIDRAAKAQQKIQQQQSTPAVE